MKRALMAIATVAGAALMAGLFVANLRSDPDKRVVHRAALHSACSALAVAVIAQSPKSGGEAVLVVKHESASKLFCPIHRIEFKVNTNAVLLLKSVSTNNDVVLVCPQSLPEGIFGYE